MDNGPMTRREFLSAIGVGAATFAVLGEKALGGSTTQSATTMATTASAPSGRKPNIIVLLADDLGYADLGCQGCKDIPTPNIDSIAKAGVRFTQGYVTCPVCSPSRAGLLTGRYQTRFGHEFNFTPLQARTSDVGLPLSEVTIADRLRKLGYVTGAVGKWHQGTKPHYHPSKRGFDEFYGFLGGSRHYLSTDKTASLMRDEHEVKQETEYLTEDFALESASFIRKHKDVPFFLYVAFNAVHMPLEATKKYRDRFEGKITDPKRLIYAGMLSAMDDAVGAVLDELLKDNLEQDTLVFFISDNGGPTVHTTSSNAPLSGGKGGVQEGGIRIPFVAQWKGRIPAGQTVDAPIISLDVVPTAIAAAGGTLAATDKVDGVNILPFLTGQTTQKPHQQLFWRIGRNHVIRQGDWKLVYRGDDPTPKLYNLADDIGEKNDLAAKEPTRVKSLQAAYDKWNSQNIPPKWVQEKRAATNAVKGDDELGD